MTSITQLRSIVRDLDRNAVAQYFLQDDVGPYVLCDGVDVAVFNQYFGQENCAIPGRCVELLEGQLLIVEYPLSAVHECTIGGFAAEFHQFCGNDRKFATKGSMTCQRDGSPNKEADATFGPMGSTPGRTPPPVLKDRRQRTIADWITLVVEVGRTQDWASLERAAIWWLNYTGIQYVLLIKVSKSARSMTYRLYDVQDYSHPNQLPPPAASESFEHQENGPAVDLSLDNRRILSIPVAENLPPGVNDESVIDLRAVMVEVIESIN
ncbi:unnamed protein product [Aphanomyces euteiches]